MLVKIKKDTNILMFKILDNFDFEDSPACRVLNPEDMDHTKEYLFSIKTLFLEKVDPKGTPGGKVWYRFIKQ